MSNFINLKDQDIEARIFFHRTIWMLVFIVSLIGLLISQLIKLQIVEYQNYTTQSKDNYIHVESEPPSRGLIFDRNGVVLAENKPALSLHIIPEKIRCRARRKHKLCIRDLFKELRLHVTLDERDLEKFYALYRKNRRYAKNFMPILLRQNLTEEEQATIAAISHRLPGVYITPSLNRYYPYPTSLAHVIGYVRAAGKKEESQWTPEEKKNYAGTTHIGVQGIEKQYEKILHGQVGKTEVERNVYGRVAKSKPLLKPVAGKNIYLTIDIKLQTIAEKALGKKAGAVVAIDTKTGQVLALVSNPGFDPNLFVTGISVENYKKLQKHRQKPLNARAVIGTYPPGSTIKPFYGLGSLVYKRMEPSTPIMCRGKYFLPGVKRPWRDWKKSGHGSMSLAKAIMRSCDVYFYELANRMKIDRITKTLAMFGWGSITGIDMPQEKKKRNFYEFLPKGTMWQPEKFSWKGKFVYDPKQQKSIWMGEYRDVGVLPSRKWKAWRFRHHSNPWERKWYPGDTINVGIGQGNVTITPLQLAVATATMANRGKLVIPHLLRAVQPAGSKEIIYLNPGIKNEDIPEYTLPPAFLAQQALRQQALSQVKDWQWDVIHKGMIAVIHGWNDSGWGGTARRLIKITKKRFKIAGKTGTAQVFSVHKDKTYKKSELPEHLWDNALFMTFAPAKNPRIAIAVVVEHGGHGGAAAAPVAAKLLKAYLADMLVDDPKDKIKDKNKDKSQNKKKNKNKNENKLRPPTKPANIANSAKPKNRPTRELAKKKMRSKTTKTKQINARRSNNRRTAKVIERSSAIKKSPVLIKRRRDTIKPLSNIDRTRTNSIKKPRIRNRVLPQSDADTLDGLQL